MSHTKKLKVIVLYGGKSGEHEVSLRSAASVFHRLDRNRFEVLPVWMDKRGGWHEIDAMRIESTAEALPADLKAPRVVLLPQGEDAIVPGLVRLDAYRQGSTAAFTQVDAVFPVVHGTFCEDGTLQGLLELADVPYVGCGVLASSVGMDKDFTKRILHQAGVPVVPWICVKQSDWPHKLQLIAETIERDLGFPVFVKPANSGSSVGVHKVKGLMDLSAALVDAFSYDPKVLVEKAVAAREIELSVLENSDPSKLPRVSVPGEIVPNHEFYSYEAKYLDQQGAQLQIPAQLDPSQMERAQALAQTIFHVIECEGMARVDLFLDRVSGDFYLNEINTLPGFTSISMYPKLWEKSGLGYSDLLSSLVDLAMARHKRKAKLKRDL